MPPDLASAFLRRCITTTIGLLLILLTACGHAESRRELRLDRALSVQGDTAVFPPGGDSAALNLPDDWSETRPRAAGPIWYRLRFDAAPDLGDDELLALYIERVCGNLEVRLNGERLSDGTVLREPMMRRCYRPFLVGIPATLLRASGNELDIKVGGLPLERVASRLRAGYLSAVRLGPYTGLAAEAGAQRFWRETLAQVIAAVLLTLGVVVLLVGWLNTRKSYLLYFGLLAIGWALLTGRIWLARLPPEPEVLEWAVLAALPLVAAFAVIFLMRYAGLRSRPLDAALLVQCAIVPASLVLAGPNRLFLLAHSWSLLLMIEVLLAAGVSVWLTWQLRRREFWFLLGPLFVIGLAAGAELAWQQRWINETGPDWLALAMPLGFVAFGLRLLYGEMRGLRVQDIETRNLIDRRVQEATAEAERNYGVLADLRVEQVTERERKRIAADLHDDLGAKLLTIVHTSESDRISTLAREALEEMRLSVRGLTGKPVRLADALGDWRAEVVSRLGQANIGADWQSPPEEPQQTLPARAYVQTTRILREAVSNIIKHSGAARCSVSGRVQDGDFVLVIQDNGRGIPMELDGKLDRGHGMASMKQRAKQLQGQCLVESGPGYGTVIRLTIPL